MLAFLAFLVPKVHWGLKNMWKKFLKFPKKIEDDDNECVNVWKAGSIYVYTRSLGALRAPTSSLRPFGPAFGPSGLLDFVLRALRALRPCDPQKKFSRNPKR